LRQRTAREQLLASRAPLSERARLTLIGVAVCLLTLFVVAAMAWVAANPSVPPECQILYRQARTAADTARIDAIVFPKKNAIACGVARLSVEG
jgi:hypothetical protein